MPGSALSLSTNLFLSLFISFYYHKAFLLSSRIIIIFMHHYRYALRIIIIFMHSYYRHFYHRYAFIPVYYM
jgi:hypothetical protein